MIALIPSDKDKERLVVPNGETADDLHLTLCYWAEPDGDRFYLEMVRAAASMAANFPAFTETAFSVDWLNPKSEKNCIVVGVTGDTLAIFRQSLIEMTGTGDIEEPWVAHMTIRYDDQDPDMHYYSDLTGPVTFTHIRVAFGGDYVDYPLSGPTLDVEAEDDGPMLESDDAMDMEEDDSEYASVAPDCGCDGGEDTVVAGVNSKSWQSMPIADRETPWNASEAISRISTWAGNDGSKFGRPFLWKADDGQPLNPDSYRLPIADVVNGKLVMIPRAVFQAGTILSGGHGYLEGVVPDDERTELKATVTAMYDKLQELYQDPRVVAPWLRGRTPGEREEEVANMEASIVAAVNRSGWSDLPIAETSRPWDGNAARSRLRSWADGDMRKYRRGFLWWDDSAPENFGSYKLPIADVIDGTLTIIPRAVSAALGAIAGARGGVDIPSSDMAATRSVLEGIRGRFEDNSTTASGGPLAPPTEWFADPKLSGPTPLTVTADGRVYGHLAAWNVCHAGITNKCVMAPRSYTGYKYFLNGKVLTADGSQVRVGRLTVGTGHADPMMGYIPAADHYDNTGTAVAITASGEDRYGIWVAGAVVPGVSEEKVAELRRSPLSGDWRRSPEGTLELVAALAVNTPGFPIVKFGQDNVQASLLAAGIVLPEGVQASGVMPELEPESQVSHPRLEALEDKVAKILAGDRRRRIANVFDRFGG